MREDSEIDFTGLADFFMVTIVVGTLTIFLVGLAASKFLGRGGVRKPEL